MRIDEMYDEIIREAVDRAYDAGYRLGYESGRNDGILAVLCGRSLSGGNAVNCENNAESDRTGNGLTPEKEAA